METMAGDSRCTISLTLIFSWAPAAAGRNRQIPNRNAVRRVVRIEASGSERPFRRGLTLRAHSSNAGQPGQAGSRKLCRTGGGFLFVGVVGGADQRAGFDVLEAEGKAVAADSRELVRMIEAHDRQVPDGRLQVLADGDDVHVLRAQVAECGEDFVVGPPEAQHDAALRWHLLPQI